MIHRARVLYPNSTSVLWLLPIIVMRVLLDVATILGGIAAIWFFFQQLLALRDRTVHSREPNADIKILSPRQTQSSDANKSGPSTGLSLASISIVSMAGLVAGLSSYFWGSLVACGVSLGGLALCYAVGKMFEKGRNEEISAAFFMSGVFLPFWGLIGVLVEAILNIFAGITFPIQVSLLKDTRAGLILSIGEAILGGIMGALLHYDFSTVRRQRRG